MTNEKAKSYLLGIAEGEKGALSGFVSTVSGRVRYIADGILHDSSLADDVLSIVIERVWQKRRFWRGSKPARIHKYHCL